MNRDFLYCPQSGSKVQADLFYRDPARVVVEHNNGSHTFFGGVASSFFAANPGQYWRQKAATAATAFLQLQGVQGVVWDDCGAVGTWLPAANLDAYLLWMSQFMPAELSWRAEAAAQLIQQGWTMTRRDGERTYAPQILHALAPPRDHEEPIYYRQAHDQLWFWRAYGTPSRLPASEVKEIRGGVLLPPAEETPREVMDAMRCHFNRGKTWDAKKLSGWLAGHLPPQEEGAVRPWPEMCAKLVGAEVDAPFSWDDVISSSYEWHAEEEPYGGWAQCVQEHGCPYLESMEGEGEGEEGPKRYSLDEVIEILSEGGDPPCRGGTHQAFFEPGPWTAEEIRSAAQRRETGDVWREKALRLFATDC